MRAQEKTRLATVQAVTRASVQAHIQWLDVQIKALDGDLAGRLKRSPLYAAKYELLAGVPGMGRVTITTLLGRLPELGAIAGKSVAALVGLAPFADDSGKRRGQQYVQGGRAQVRCVLYMTIVIALSALPFPYP